MMDFSADCWPIVILTLEGDDERRRGLLRQLDILGLQYRLHFGVNGRQGLPDRYEEMIDRGMAEANAQRPLTDGEFACALSHREIYQWVVDNELPGAIVLEDDAIVDERFLKFLRTKAFKAGNLIMLDHSHARVWGKEQTLADGSTARLLSLASCLTTAYSVSQSGCRYLMGVTHPVAELADWPGDICSIGAMVLDPQIVAHPDPNDGPSHIRDGRKKSQRKRSPASRFISGKFWRRWIIKRMSRRIS